MMVVEKSELLAASDETIERAVLYADPMVLRGLLYQLTADESLVSVSLDAIQAGVWAQKKITVTDPSDLALIRSKAAEFLKSCRDSGVGDVPIGPAERLSTSLALTAGEELPEAELEMWVEQLALDPFARGLESSQLPSKEQLEDFVVVVVGAGIGGLNAAVQLSHAGIPFIVLEKNPEVGGTWFENRYPGARIDTPSRTYTHIFGANFIYPSPYCDQSENEKYVNWVADHFDIRKHIQFNTEVKSMTWDEAANVWEIVADHEDGQRILRVNAVITAVGCLSRPSVPHIPGLDEFGGDSFHSARWPSHADLTGKNVAVIGSGCTGYQLVPELVHEVGHTYLFQRTPSWVVDVPGYLSPYPSEVSWLDRNFPYIANFVRFQNSWMQRPEVTKAAYEVDPEFDDPYAVSAANKEMRDQRLAFMRSKLADRPDLMAKMVPACPPLSTRLVRVDPTYNIYDALLRDDVTLVTEGIDRVTEDGILLQDGSKCAVDVIVLATGFRANDYLWPMEIRGRDGIRTEELWAKDGARAYLGAMLPGFPNFFMIFGPNTSANVGFAAIHLQELVTRFALECIAGMITQGGKTVDVTLDAYWRFNDELDKAASSKVYLDPRAHSYFTNEHGRSATNGAIDGRVLWNWLRNPAGSEPAGSNDVISPYFGHDIVVE